MKANRFHLAQANVARMRAPLDDPIMEGFRSQLDRINAIADRSPGFVWRLQTDEGNATAIRASDDERILFNMSETPAGKRFQVQTFHLLPTPEQGRSIPPRV
jgi:hypothetical protein